MKRLSIVLVPLLLSMLVAGRATAEGASFVRGGFEMAGYLSVGAGWQRFSNDPVTEAAADGSFAGVLGSVLPNVASGTVPSPGEDDASAFVEVAELDIIKQIGERARVRADLYFGRTASGSWVGVPGVDIAQAYGAVTLSQRHGIELQVGRFITQAGFEAYRPYENDTISWSILTRALLYPAFITGIQLSANLADRVELHVAVGNSLTDDSNARINDLPGALATIFIAWGEKEHRNTLTITPYVSPESQSNRHLTYGSDATLIVWPSKTIKMGLQGVYRRDDGNGGPNTDYAGGLVNLRWNATEALFGVARYAYARQFAAGNGVWNLTGARQQIHEMSLGGGYHIADGSILKFEGRVDAVVPAGGATQWTPGVALGLACAF